MVRLRNAQAASHRPTRVAKGNMRVAESYLVGRATVVGNNTILPEIVRNSGKRSGKPQGISVGADSFRVALQLGETRRTWISRPAI